MKQYNLRDIFEELHEAEFSQFNNAPAHRFSLKHRRAMKKIFESGCGVKYKPVRLTRRTALIAAVMIFLALVTAGIIVFRIAGFSGNVHDDNIHLFAVDDNGFPETIEQVWELGDIPEGYELTDRVDDADEKLIIWTYKNTTTSDVIVFKQYTKDIFNVHYGTDKHAIEDVKVNSLNGFIWSSMSKGNNLMTIVWENEDYIFLATGTLDKNAMIGLAESAKIQNN